jgi:pimeloyl-ACP methyl ester carboxylesterase
MADYFPIVYVRGDSLGAGDVDDALASPHDGFNLGATTTQLINRTLDENDLRVVIFESPVVRLMKEEGYVDAFNTFVDVSNAPLEHSVPRASGPRVDWTRTLWVFRVSHAGPPRGGGQAPAKIDDHAGQLALFLDGVRRACGNPPGFKVNLVAHGMGGLICRSYLQHTTLFEERDGLRAVVPVAVNKLVTYGTPHAGLRLRHGVGAVADPRDLVGFRGAEALGETEMRRYLSLPSAGSSPTQPLHAYACARGELPVERILCVVGTDHAGYVGWVSRKAAGPASDGVVAIESAHVRGAARAFVHRAHAGPRGMVNSEEGYQNLTRFLFGDVRLEMLLEPIEMIGHPGGVNPADDALDYLLIEGRLIVRGLTVYLQSRRAEHQSAITLDVTRGESGVSWGQTTHGATHLFTAYLRSRAKTKPDDPFLRLAIDLRIEPHYRHRGVTRASRFEGEAIVDDRLHVALLPAATPVVMYRWNAESTTDRPLAPAGDGTYLVPLTAAAARYLICRGLRLTPSVWS